MKRKEEQTKPEKKQLFLLHFAGGSCYSFDFLKGYIDESIDFIPLEIPGRGRRFREKLLTTKELVVQDYFAQIKELRNNHEYIIYGHSMGATLSLSIAKKMQEVEDKPSYLIVSGNPGPGIKKTDEEKEKEKKRGKRYLMTDDDFKEELRKLGGVPEEVLGNEELYSFFSPIMRADFELLEKDDYSEEGIKLDIPIYALMGAEEETNDKIENWSRFTNSSFTSKIFPGGHFFIHDYPKELIEVIMNCYENHTPVRKPNSLVEL